MDISEEAFSNL